MKLYTGQAPNPFRVEVFLAEKGLDIQREKVDVTSGVTRQPQFLQLNSLGEVPVLQTDDGTLLTESVAICRYLECLYPDTPLLGADALQQAQVEMWNRRMEQMIMGPIAHVGQHTFDFFADKFEQIPEFAASQQRLLQKRWAWLEQELSDDRPFIAGASFSIADITGMAALLICDFAGHVVPDQHERVKRWENVVRARPSWQF